MKFQVKTSSIKNYSFFSVILKKTHRTLLNFFFSFKLLQKLKRKERQIQLEAEMKGELMPYFRARQITRQSYKDILKICMKKVSLCQKKPVFLPFTIKYSFSISKEYHVRW